MLNLILGQVELFQASQLAQARNLGDVIFAQIKLLQVKVIKVLNLADRVLTDRQ